MHAQLTRDRLCQIRGRTELRDEATQTKVQEMVTALARFQENLEKKLAADSTRFDVARACSRLSDFATIIVEWTEKVRTTNVGGGDG